MHICYATWPCGNEAWDARPTDGTNWLRPGSPPPPLSEPFRLRHVANDSFRVTLDLELKWRRTEYLMRYSSVFTEAYNSVSKY